MKMKRKFNKRLLAASFIIVILACGLCALGAAYGSVYLKTIGTASENVEHFFESVLSGDGESCTACTDSYQMIDFDYSEEEKLVRYLCKALKKSYSYEALAKPGSRKKSLSEASTVRFSSFDFNKLTADITEQYEDYVYDIVKEYDKNVTTEDGKYIPEVYEKAYVKAVKAALKHPKDYYSSKTLNLDSVYDPDRGCWRTAVDNNLANMLQGGLSEGIGSDTLSVPAAVRGYVEDSLAFYKGDPVKRRKNYSLSYNSVVAPKPDASKYVSVPVGQADRVLNIISYARSCGLLEGQDVIFNLDAKFYPENIVYYCDDSILVICWKEYIKGCVCNCMEVKLADGSQIRRKLTDDTYGSGKLDTASNMAAATNAVAAMSADYYAYRDIGVTVYQGELYRYQLSCEVLMIDENGRFLFYYPDDKSSQELQKYIDHNKIQFSLAFGPVLIDNYEPHYYSEGYAFGLGEMTERYSRAAFGEFDDLHYLFMTAGSSEKTDPPADLNAFIKILRTKKLKNAYNLDGGQTAEIVFRNKPYNHIDYGGERQVSDMVYFATAVSGSTDD